ncbi:hypothetical protein NECAME_09500 [Necator americanus]|nr:hypothetical protein NECAME_09500 [Necator americanus]ETN79929.1 hypothetical protein NECAME_09500 [Necator americanus]
MGGLGDVNLRSGKSILKGASETIMINGEAKPLSELSAQEALEALIGPGKSIKGKKRRSAANNRVSISAGLIPESATRMSLTGDGKMRFKFRKADARGCLSGISEYPKYLEHVMEAHKQWAQETAALPYCGRLLDIEASVWQTAYESSHLPFISKESVGFRIRETDDKSGHEKVPETCERLRVFSSTELKREIYDHVTIAYCGGPINTISIAPNTMPGNEEVVAIVAYPCDTSLVGKDMMKTSSYIQFWMHKCKGLR